MAVGVAGLVRIDLPDATVIRLSEGAALRWGAETYVPRHATYGAVAGVESMAEGVGGEVPAMQLVLHPPSTASAADLVQPGAQQARVRCWIVDYDPETATVLTVLSAAFDGFLDQARLTRGPGKFALDITVVSMLERLFELNIGNWCSPTFHKAVWPGETGEDQATGLVIQDAWGVESPPSQAAGGGFAGGGGGFAKRAPWEVAAV